MWSIRVVNVKPDRFQLFADAVKDYAFIHFDAQNRVTQWNTGAERILGYAEDEIAGHSGAIFFTPEDRARGEHERESQIAIADGRAEDERWHVRKDGSRFRASGVMTPLRDASGQVVGFAKVFRDVTERERARERVERALEEKDALLREIHHRVKNNLQVIVSLLSVQTRYISDGRASELLAETQNRVRAIARIHESLYGSVDLARVPFGCCLRQLIADLMTFYAMEDRIVAEVDVQDITVDIERAIPLALITNEMVCNALKHAFPNGRSGKIAVVLHRSSGKGKLAVSDDGIGLPDSFEIETGGSMGFHLIRILSAQLEARIEVSLRPGTHIELDFPMTEE